MGSNLDLEVFSFLINKKQIIEYIKVLVRTVTGIFKRPIQEMKNPNSNAILGLIKGIYGVNQYTYKNILSRQLLA